MSEDSARSLKDDAVRAAKLRRIDDQHVRALNALVRAWRAADAGRRIPWFDPDDGGIHSRTLVLMETPGPKTVRDGESGFCSEDNDDPTAATLHRLRVASGLSRTDYLRWNIVPWAVYDRHGHWASPNEADLRMARPALQELLALLPDLRLVICMGARALSGFMQQLTLEPPNVLPLVLGVPHPSQRNTHARTEAIVRIENALRVAGQMPTYKGNL